jgi:hypothetical protein
LSSPRRFGSASSSAREIPWRSAPAWAGDAAAVHAGHDVHARLVAHRLQGLADRALQRGAREERVELLAVDRVGARARLEDDARDGRLALARRAVARVRGEVDRRGDGLQVEVVVLRGGGGLGLGGLALLAGQGVLALGDDVHLEVHAGDRRLDAGRVVLVVLVVEVGGGGRGIPGGARHGGHVGGRRAGGLLGAGGDLRVGGLRGLGAHVVVGGAVVGGRLEVVGRRRLVGHGLGLHLHRDGLLGGVRVLGAA